MCNNTIKRYFLAVVKTPYVFTGRQLWWVVQNTWYALQRRALHGKLFDLTRYCVYQLRMLLNANGNKSDVHFRPRCRYKRAINYIFLKWVKFQDAEFFTNARKNNLVFVFFPLHRSDRKHALGRVKFHF